MWSTIACYLTSSERQLATPQTTLDDGRKRSCRDVLIDQVNWLRNPKSTATLPAAHCGSGGAIDAHHRYAATLVGAKLD